VGDIVPCREAFFNLLFRRFEDLIDSWKSRQLF